MFEARKHRGIWRCWGYAKSKQGSVYNDPLEAMLSPCINHIAQSYSCVSTVDGSGIKETLYWPYSVERLP